MLDSKLPSLRLNPAIIVAVFVVLFLIVFLQRPWQGVDTDTLSKENRDSQEVKPGSPMAKWQAEETRLLQHLDKQPDDASSWVFLARVRLRLERIIEAVQAFEQAYAIMGDEPDLLVEYAEVLAQASYGEMQGRPRVLLEKALSIDPDHGGALWFMGMAAWQDKEYKKAVEHWQRLLLQVPLHTSEHDSLRDRIAMAQYEMMIPDFEPGTMAQGGMQEMRSIAGVKVRVSLSPELNGKLSPDKPVFIFASERHDDKQFSSVPVAVLRRKVSDLPMVVKLNDQHSLKRSRHLSLYREVRVGATITEVGRTGVRAGDWQGAVASVRLGLDEPVELVIDTRVTEQTPVRKGH